MDAGTPKRAYSMDPPEGLDEATWAAVTCKLPEVTVGSMPQDASMGGHQLPVHLGHPPLINQQMGLICERLMNERHRRMREDVDKCVLCLALLSASAHFFMNHEAEKLYETTTGNYSLYVVDVASQEKVRMRELCVGQRPQ
ncbi:hypothetical protein MTO96_011950 [Rhipicephalus appendiculatus]